MIRRTHQAGQERPLTAGVAGFPAGTVLTDWVVVECTTEPVAFAGCTVHVCTGCGAMYTTEAP